MRERWEMREEKRREEKRREEKRREEDREEDREEKLISWLLTCHLSFYPFFHSLVDSLCDALTDSNNRNSQWIYFSFLSLSLSLSLSLCVIYVSWSSFERCLYFSVVLLFMSRATCHSFSFLFMHSLCFFLLFFSLPSCGGVTVDVFCPASFPSSE